LIFARLTIFKATRFVAGEAGFLARHSSTNASLAAGRDLKADPAQAWAPAWVPASAPVSCPAASAAGRDLGVSPGSAASQGQAAFPGSAAAADSGGRGSVESPAAGVVAAAGAAVGADLDALRAAWVGVAAADAAEVADASNSRGARTKDDPHSNDPNSRRD
jgi:hypothetical protein